MKLKLLAVNPSCVQTAFQTACTHYCVTVILLYLTLAYCNFRKIIINYYNQRGHISSIMFILHLLNYYSSITTAQVNKFLRNSNICSLYKALGSNECNTQRIFNGIMVKAYVFHEVQLQSILYF